MRKPTVYVSDVINAPLATVWHVMRDFNGLALYHPAIMESHIEQGQTGSTVGAIRYLRLETGFVREQLLMMDDVAHTFSYAIIEGTLPVRHYQSCVKLFAISEGDRTFCQWSADFEVESHVSRDAMIELVGQGVFKLGLQSVASFIQKQKPGSF